MLPIEVQAGGVASPLAGVFGNDSFGVQAFETADEGQGDDDGGDDDGLVVAVNRSLDTGPGQGVSASSGKKAKSNPELNLSLEGLNFHDSRFANGGNQFSVEPPDQGLCAGNGFVVETVNSVLRIYRSNGTAVTLPIDVNTFYGYAPAVDRFASPVRFGPEVTDPSCYFDAPTQRWFHLAVTLERANVFTQDLAGPNHLDLAVSQTADPAGNWNVYRIPVQNDGTEGTPDHGCRMRVGTSLVHGPCFGDYPHIGADANGIYLTTNEFDLAPGQFHAAQIYAVSKSALVSGAASIEVFTANTGDPAFAVTYPGGQAPGFTVWPATSPAAAYDASANGTEYLLSSDAVFFSTRTSHDLVAWSITNTASLGTASPAPVVHNALVPSTPYSVPGRSEQKVGDIPLRDCIADTTCSALLGLPPTANVEQRPTSNDSRMQQVVFANGKLWGALDTGLVFDGDPTPRAGIAWFVLKPTSTADAVSGIAAKQGYLGLAGQNLTYPAVGVTASGRGVIAFTLLGHDYYPSAGYASLDAQVGVGDIHVAAAGLGPEDGFTGYVPFFATQNRPRWGDYGATAVDGNSIWLGSEYIGQTCNLAQYLAEPIATCGGTRGALGNWGTRITKVTP
ncbi:MAG TPA: hypothetical protein VHQ89_12470 [Gaiellaceae bacterium]|jgi:hypothetical protein|nr:hypothetical protein [Gaiellaceae bacterium]